MTDYGDGEGVPNLGRSVWFHHLDDFLPSPSAPLAASSALYRPPRPGARLRLELLHPGCRLTLPHSGPGPGPARPSDPPVAPDLRSDRWTSYRHRGTPRRQGNPLRPYGTPRRHSTTISSTSPRGGSSGDWGPLGGWFHSEFLVGRWGLLEDWVSHGVTGVRWRGRESPRWWVVRQGRGRGGKRDGGRGHSRRNPFRVRQEKGVLLRPVKGVEGVVLAPSRLGPSPSAHRPVTRRRRPRRTHDGSKGGRTEK